MIDRCISYLLPLPFTFPGFCTLHAHSLTPNDSQFKILSSEILELPSVAADPKFASPSERVVNRVELCDLIERRLREESRDVWMVKFKGKGYIAFSLLQPHFPR